MALGVVSFLTDLSSEMIYPLLPAFLVTIGATGAFVGLIEGIAETTAALLKLGSGLVADRIARRKPLVVIGYGISSLARPLIALAQAPLHVLAIRFADRVGKGIRSTPRDALIADSVEETRRGAAFGFHRGMDHLGAVVGPLVAFALLYAAGVETRWIFALAAIPAAATMIVLAVAVREQASGLTPRASARPGMLFGGSRLPARLWAYLAVAALFTLGRASDLFLLLRAHALGVGLEVAPLVWAAHHVVKAALSAPLGALSDRVGRRVVIAWGWAVAAAVFVGFAVATEAWHAWVLFLVYGAHFALFEGAEKALVADLAPKDARGKAFGVYNFVLAVCALPASFGFGLVLDATSFRTAFLVGAALMAAATVGVIAVTRRTRPA